MLEPQLIMGTKIAVIAVGGNSLIRDKRHVSVKDQYDVCYETAEHIFELARQGWKIVITHGNGPQVGFVLRRCEVSKHEMPMQTLDACVADTQGGIGYLLQRALNNVFLKNGIKRPVVTIITQVAVDPNDSAFKNPSKPIGAFLKEADARLHEKKDGWRVLEDAGRGYRRVVASPKPKEIVEIDAIRDLVNSGAVVISAGGGGIPVVRKTDGTLDGIEAVIDKDYASCLLAKELKADCFVISTGVDKVYLDYGKASQRQIDIMTTEEAARYMEEEQFAKGSMLPKVSALVDFVNSTGGFGVISSPCDITDAVNKKAGTRIIL